jgi:uncharacterized protein (DUF58 family)
MLRWPLSLSLLGRQHLQAWWAARHPRSDTHRMGQRNTYILPSTAGLAFGLTLAVLLLASINEQLSLGYALSFLLTGAGLASMHATHGNLRGLSLALRTPSPAFAGEDVALDVALHNEGAARYGIGLRALSSAQTKELAWVDVPQRGHARLQLRYAAARRGLQPLPALHIQTHYPLGLFRVWSLWRPQSQIWIYPRPEPDAPPPPAGDTEPAADAQAPFTRSQAGPDMEGVRSYQRGDAARSVLWKKSSLQLEQGQALLVRDTRSPQAGECWLAWQATAGLADDEARLSRLCAWVLAAEAAQRPYGLRLPGRELPPGLGAEQRQRCLEALASYAPSAAGAA